MTHEAIIGFGSTVGSWFYWMMALIRYTYEVMLNILDSPVD